VNPPNPTGYSPTMMVFCMNDPGPILDTKVGSPTQGQMITDPLYSVGYSQFCYELPFMPYTTQYLDTPVVPTSAFAGAGYNNVDCAYPALTPAIKEVDGDGIGPWVSAAGHTLTITALGDTTVPNYAYSGPSATTAPYNQKTIVRHYGFGAARGTVMIDGKNATVNSWSDTTITVSVPSGVTNCAVQQQRQYSGLSSTAPATQCGELVITAATGQQSIDTVTVTIGGKTPTPVLPTDSIQAKIDAAKPGDMLMVYPTCTASATSTVLVPCAVTGQTHSTAAHNELVIMWKPVRLQGVGAVSSIIDATTHPAGKLDAWRQKVNCLFGLALNGSPISTSGTVSSGGPNANANPYDPTGAASCTGAGWPGFTSYDESGTNGNPNNATVDRLPLEAVLGWNAELNGNLAEQLQETSLMGALEGAGITVLGKGVSIPSDQYAASLLSGFPTGTTLLTASNCGSNNSNSTNPFPTNFFCNPSSIDAMGITQSSQGGGAIFMHGWNHKIQIANNRILSNAGTLSGGINAAQGEYPPATIKGGATNAAPYEAVSDFCAAGRVPFTGTSTIPTNAVEPYCFNVDINIHNNDISLNSSTGDELFSATPAGAGGVSICTGNDYYKFNYNWVCGNLSSGDGGGVGHLGFSYAGDMEHNTIIFNQSINPTIPANGGGLLIAGAPDADLACNGNITVDQDCAPFGAPGGNPGNTPVNAVGPSGGTGPGLVVNANLIMGNSAETGTGGGIDVRAVNGSDVVAMPTTPQYWNSVKITNNIITNNVAGWDGGGVSFLDSLNVKFINNTVMSNNSTATAGILFTTLGAPLASQPGTNCLQTGTSIASCPQIAGVVAIQHSAVFAASLPATVICPPGNYTTVSATNGNCRTLSVPALYNNVLWQNQSLYVGVTGTTPATANPATQQSVVTMYNAFTNTIPASQSTTGQCFATPSSYWDLGVRGDTGPTNHSGGMLAPFYSILTPGSSGYNATNSNTTPPVVHQYCNGSRSIPEAGLSGWQVPPGISDATVPNPIFNLTPVATVDEGNNWVNLRWGPLSLVNPATSTSTTNVAVGNYSLSAAIDNVPTNEALPTGTSIPTTDFFGNARPEAGGDTHIDAGAVEFGSTAGGGGGGGMSASLTPATWTVAQTRNCPGTGFGILACLFDPTQVFTLTNTGTVPLTGVGAGVLGGTATNVANYAIIGLFSNCGNATHTTLAPGATCTVAVQFKPLTAQPTGLKAATISVSTGAGTQTSTLNGTAN